MAVYAGIDLHSNNNYLGLINDEDRRLFTKRLPNDLGRILDALSPFREELRGIVVESTFNWYWLVDGLQEQGYRVHLANPSAIQQYAGLKYRDDKWDSFWLAHLLRLNLLQEGYVYPKETRPIRDLLRRRMQLVQQRTSHILSLQSMIARHRGVRISGTAIKRFRQEDAAGLFEDKNLLLAAENNIVVMKTLTERIGAIEKSVLDQTSLRREFSSLLTIPGIGKILGLTIMLEVGDVTRFAQVGNYASYCRCVDSRHLSNDKKKGAGNSKNGNRYLSWAYVEAAHHARRACPSAQRFFQRKAAKAKRVVAVKALAHKLCRASYYIMRDKVPFDEERLFRPNSHQCSSEPSMGLATNHEI